ncbi:unnamed protein product [Dicrocoelium dendriticum]|nr:unnamed protein product [Dicrocoelium dendriticum]
MPKIRKLAIQRRFNKFFLEITSLLFSLHLLSETNACFTSSNFPTIFFYCFHFRLWTFGIVYYVVLYRALPFCEIKKEKKVKIVSYGF